MELPSALLASLCALTLFQVASGTQVVTALYGEVIRVPCNNDDPPPNNLVFIKWKYDKGNDVPGNLLVKQAHKDQVKIEAEGDYAHRVSIGDKYSLLIQHATLSDQKTFICIMVSDANLREFPVEVVVHKQPSAVQIMDRPDALQKDKSTTVGTCVVTDANPAATITWKKNGKLLVADGKGIVISPSMKIDPSTSLSTSSSTLQYVATKEDDNAVFTCVSTHELANQDFDMEPLPLHYPPEQANLQIMSNNPIVEGENVTLKCHADGNPPPTSFYFHIQGQKILSENADTYTLTAISRDAAGEYKCSVADNEKIEASQHIVVSYLDLSLSPTGKVIKTVGESLSVKMEKSASSDATVSWTKNGKAVKEPEFSKLTYADAGLYECEASIAGLVQHRSFELVVQGKPVITSLTKHRADDANYKVLTCEAQSVPEPYFQWSVNSTNEEKSYINGKATHKITVIPKVNLTVYCNVSNTFGDDVRSISVSSIFGEENEGKADPQDEQDQSKLIVGVVVVLLIVAAAVALIYWLYMKNTRQGSWKTGEEMGTSEESKKLEENNHNV